MRRAYTFRSTLVMEQCMDELMQDWEIDRTSVIKLSLYLLSIHMKQCRISHSDLYGLIHELELLAPPGFPDYASFAD
ncbi:MAG: hypothetical protein E7032_04915 [Akkermansiaceae bacterium]|nr:hypothetical protein [Akkermansiaceae bacterium]